MLPILPYFLEKDPQSLVNHATAKLIQISRKSHEVPQGRVKNYANISGDKKLVNNENKTFVIPDPFDLLTGLSEASPSSATSFEVRKHSVEKSSKNVAIVTFLFSRQNSSN